MSSPSERLSFASFPTRTAMCRLSFLLLFQNSHGSVGERIGRVSKQPIIALYFESETVVKFYNLEA